MALAWPFFIEPSGNPGELPPKILENRSDFVPLCIYTADLKSRIRKSQDSTTHNRETKMTRRRDWLYETPAQETFRLRLWREMQAKMISPKWRQSPNDRSFLKKDSSEEIQMLLDCLKSHKEKLAQDRPCRVVIERHYNENEYVREGRNGRLYAGVIGWRWFPKLDGEMVGDPEGYKTLKEASAAASLAKCQLQAVS